MPVADFADSNHHYNLHMDLAYLIAGNAASRNFNDLSSQTMHATVDGLIHSLACALAGTNAPGLREARSALVQDLSLKPYPACRFTHAPIDLALQLHGRGVRPRDVQHIRIRVSAQAVNMVGRKFDCRTAGVVDAQFSIAYTVAVGLERGAVRIGDFTEETLREPRVGAFAAEKITIQADESVPMLAMVPVYFDVELGNGQRLALATQDVSGSPEKRMTAAQLRDKVVDCLGYGKSRVDPDELVAMQKLVAGLGLTKE